MISMSALHGVEIHVKFIQEFQVTRYAKFEQKTINNKV